MKQEISNRIEIGKFQNMENKDTHGTLWGKKEIK